MSTQRVTNLMLSLLAAYLAGFAGLSQANPLPNNQTANQVAVVEALQVPAWVERNGRKQAIQPGMALRTNDTLQTGEDARLLLRLADGSAVRLGAQAALHLQNVQTKQENEGLTIRGALNVLRGAFRFTTDAVAKLRTKRELDVRFATVTAGIRGTDLWGKNAPDKEIVCLIEGKISVDREVAGWRDSTLTIEGDKQFYIAPVGKPALPVGEVPAAKLAEWSQEVALQEGQGIINAQQSKVAIEIGPFDSLSQAAQILEASKSAGYPFALETSRNKRGVQYRLRMNGFASAADAQAAATRYSKQFNDQTLQIKG